jgi:hypothetical protein
VKYECAHLDDSCGRVCDVNKIIVRFVQLEGVKYFVGTFLSYFREDEYKYVVN